MVSLNIWIQFLFLDLESLLCFTQIRLDGYQWSSPFSVGSEGLMSICLRSETGSDLIHVRVEVRSSSKDSRFEVVFTKVILKSLQVNCDLISFLMTSDYPPSETVNLKTWYTNTTHGLYFPSSVYISEKKRTQELLEETEWLKIWETKQYYSFLNTVSQPCFKTHGSFTKATFLLDH